MSKKYWDPGISQRILLEDAVCVWLAIDVSSRFWWQVITWAELLSTYNIIASVSGVAGKVDLGRQNCQPELIETRVLIAHGGDVLPIHLL